MTKLSIKAQLVAKPSYLKWGTHRVASQFGVSEKVVREVVRELKGDKVDVFIPGISTLDKRTFKEFLEFKKVKERKQEVKPSKPSPRPYKGNSKNVLIIGDLHEPFTQDGYLEHCREVQERFDCGTVVAIGDLLDNHAVSYHEHDPDGHSAGHEYIEAVSKLQRWYKTFPEAYMCLGNHDLLPFRKAFTNGLPSAWMKSYNELLQVPKEWKIGFNHTVNGVLYTHGTGVSGDTGAMKIASQNRMSAVIGHLHSISNIKYSASYKDIIFSMTVGCGLDYKQYAFNYGRDFVAKPIVSCGVVINGEIPILIPMKLK